MADVYIDDFFGADTPDRAYIAFVFLKTLLAELGLETADNKQSSPNTLMLCLGILFDTVNMLMCVPEFWLIELKDTIDRHLA